MFLIFLMFCEKIWPEFCKTCLQNNCPTIAVHVFCIYILKILSNIQHTQTLLIVKIPSFLCNSHALYAPITRQFVIFFQDSYVVLIGDEHLFEKSPSS